jgi:hypothetical protein
MSVEVILLFIAFILFCVAAFGAWVSGRTWWGTLVAAGLAAWELTQLLGHIH